MVGICNFSVDDGGRWKFPEKQVNMGVINLAWFCHLSIVVLLHSVHNQKKETCSCMEYSVQSKKPLWDRRNELTERDNKFSLNVERVLMTAYSIWLTSEIKYLKLCKINPIKCLFYLFPSVIKGDEFTHIDSIRDSWAFMSFEYICIIQLLCIRSIIFFVCLRTPNLPCFLH